MSDQSDANATVAIVLAAGASSRMGRCKPLLPWGGGTLLSHTIDTVRSAGVTRVVVVWGCDAAVREEAQRCDAEPVENENWAAGPGGSIATGVAALPPAPVLILTADTPLVTGEELREVMNTPPAAAAFTGTFGPPACFPASARSTLRSLLPDRGAKFVLASYGPALRLVPIEAAGCDLDTPAAYEAAYRTHHLT